MIGDFKYIIILVILSIVIMGFIDLAKYSTDKPKNYKIFQTVLYSLMIVVIISLLVIR